MNINFDATQQTPEQGIGKHPTGKFLAVVTDVSVEENNNKDGGYVSITFTTQSGMIAKNYNLWFREPTDGQKKAIEIAQKNLAALCYATGVFKLGTGQEMINARCQIEVTPQTKNPQYNEVSKVYDANGNEPGKAPAQPTAANGGWGQAANPMPAQQQPVLQQAGWAPPGPARPTQTPAPVAAPNAPGGWQP